MKKSQHSSEHGKRLEKDEKQHEHRQDHHGSGHHHEEDHHHHEHHHYEHKDDDHHEHGHDDHGHHHHHGHGQHHHHHSRQRSSLALTSQSAPKKDHGQQQSTNLNSPLRSTPDSHGEQQCSARTQWCHQTGSHRINCSTTCQDLKPRSPEKVIVKREVNHGFSLKQLEFILQKNLRLTRPKKE